ncbi:MAG: hypothetical protein AMXMBFR33_41700 [Candidatus Xenobia bacterium]|jgi:hypothetical protein
MFSFLSKPQQVELLEVEDRTLGFRCQKENQVGQTVKVRVSLPDLPELTLPVTIKSCRPDEPGFVCYAEVPSSKGLEKFQAALHNKDKSESNVRRAQRFKLGVRILSPELPAFKAISVDFSRSGLQIEAEGDVPIDTMLTLTLETEIREIPSVICRARVIWSRPTGQFQRCRLGLEFTTLEPKMRADLDRFESYVRARFS